MLASTSFFQSLHDDLAIVWDISPIQAIFICIVCVLGMVLLAVILFIVPFRSFPQMGDRPASQARRQKENLTLHIMVRKF